MARSFPLLFLFLFALLASTSAAAQSMDERAEALRARAHSAYFEMEMDAALTYVDQALSLCVMGCSDEKRASLLVMKGMIVHVAKGDARQARAHFREALALDPNAKTDPSISNPSVEKLFAQTRAQAFDPYAATAADAPVDAGPDTRAAAEPAEGGRAFNRVFLELGYSVGLATAHEGMRAASTPILDGSADPQTDSIPENDSFVLSGTYGCGAPPGGYCVRKTQGIATLAHGLHLGAGYHFSEKFALSMRVRWNPNAGEGLMSNFLVGLRGYMRLTEARLRGFHASLLAGLMIGQIQVQPGQAPATPGGEIQRPFARTGLGGIELGAKIGYRFAPLFGVYVSPEIYAMMPDFSAGAVVTGGIELAFGRSDAVTSSAEATGPAEPELVPGSGDRDGDGLADDVDACPDRPGPEGTDGCPDLDSDGDGIPDAEDACPAAAEDPDGFEDGDGCPDLDDDGDGIPDAEDACPRTPGPASTRGCAIADRDGDTVEDRLDNCPDEPGAPANAGCASPQRVRLGADRIELLEPVEFKRGRDTIERRSYALLDDLAHVIRAHPEIAQVRIEGHTDATGSSRNNRKLSAKRANAVVRHLVKHGKVSSNRLSSKGFGPDRPIAPDARTAEEHAMNRRVEVHIVAD